MVKIGYVVIAILVGQVALSGLGSGAHAQGRYFPTPEFHPVTPDWHPATPDWRPATPDWHPATPDWHPATPD
jgi:hypothetical protein